MTMKSGVWHLVARSAPAPRRRPLRAATPLLVFAAWTLIGAFDITKRVFETVTHYGRPLQRGEVALTLESVWLWAVFTPLIFALAERYPIERVRWASRVALHGGFSVTIAALDVSVDHLVVPLLAPDHALPLLQRFVGESFINVYSYFAALAVGLAIRFHRLYNERRLRVSKLETELVATKLHALETRLRPHFLYNALHTIGGLVRTHDDGAAVRVIAGLGDLLRHTLRDDAAQEVSLERELALTRSYLDIEQARFGDKLRVHVEVAPEARDACVPSLLLQPLVENAVRHGVEASVHGGDVFVRAYRDGDALCLDVRDTGTATARAPSPRDGLGIGLATTRARLEHLYGNDHTLALAPVDGGGVTASVRIPFHTRPVELAR